MTVEKGYKTANRTKILAYLVEHKERAVTVADILASLQSEGAQVNQSTIYRYLNQLCEEKTVMKFVARKGEKATFQYTETGESCEQHVHMQCRRCGVMIHLDCEFMSVIREHMKSAYGFLVEGQGSILYGLCKDCRK